MKIFASELNKTLGTVDFYISASGFEDRCVIVGTTLDSDNIKKALIFHIEETYKASSDNILEIQKNLPHLIIEQHPKNSPLITFDKIYNILENLKEDYIDNKLKVVIDVTTFTREILLILIKAISLKRFIDYFDVTLIYTPAECYSTEGEHFWLTKGIREIRSVLGYSGMHSPSKTLLLVALTGFEEERVNEIIQNFEPHKLILGKPTKQGSINDNLNKISLEKYNCVKEKNLSIIVDEFEFSCSNILETKMQIDEIVSKYEMDYNIVICPLNNKISTLGVALAGLSKEAIQICYASANQYNIESFSENSDYFIVYNLNELLNT